MKPETTLAILALGLLLGACAPLRSGPSVPMRHPEDVGHTPPVCSSCHERDGDAAEGGRDYAFLNHTTYYADEHRHQAYQNGKLCAMCHERAFCNNCHTKTTQFNRGSPHWGDYLSRHRIDARQEPATCFRCHGNPKSAKSCKACHG